MSLARADDQFDLPRASRAGTLHKTLRLLKRNDRVGIAVDEQCRRQFGGDIVNGRDSLDKFFTNILKIKEQCNLELNQLTSRGLLIHGYGASTKGNTLLQYFGIAKQLCHSIS